MTEQVEVTDADREFVASRFSKSGDIYRRILAGEYDAFDDVQSAARFRIQSTAEVTAQRDALAEALEALIPMLWQYKDDLLRTPTDDSIGRRLGRISELNSNAHAALAAVKGNEQC